MNHRLSYKYFAAFQMVFKCSVLFFVPFISPWNLRNLYVLLMKSTTAWSKLYYVYQWKWCVQGETQNTFMAFIFQYSFSSCYSSAEARFVKCSNKLSSQSNLLYWIQIHGIFSDLTLWFYLLIFFLRCYDSKKLFLLNHLNTALINNVSSSYFYMK